MTREECVALLYRYAEYNGMGIPNLAGCREAMKMAADLLSQPSLPDNLDEAAEEFGKRQGIELAPFAKKFFKRGAEWLAGEGYTFETIMQEDDVDELVPTCPDMRNNGYSEGDKVIVQIRNKQ